MSPVGSITHQLHRLQGGDRDAAAVLWERFYARLADLARRELGRAPRAAEDEDDVVQCALFSFFRRAEQGQFSEFDNRESLWRLLARITVFKVRDLINRQKIRPQAVPPGAPDSTEESPLASVLSREPDPAFLAEMNETCASLLAELDEDHRKVAEMKLAGYTNEEIAVEIGRSHVTVERRLAFIRDSWKPEQPS